MVVAKANIEDLGSGSIVGRLKAFYSHFNLTSVNQLDQLYTTDIEFRDPIHIIHGSLALKNYFKNIATNCAFDYIDELVGENAAYITWEMSYKHPMLAWGKPLKLRGMSHIKYTDKIYFQEDSYDLGAMVYENFPILGWLIAFVKNRLGGST